MKEYIFVSIKYLIVKKDRLIERMLIQVHCSTRRQSGVSFVVYANSYRS